VEADCREGVAVVDDPLEGETDLVDEAPRQPARDSDPSELDDVVAALQSGQHYESGGEIVPDDRQMRVVGISTRIDRPRGPELRPNQPRSWAQANAQRRPARGLSAGASLQVYITCIIERRSSEARETGWWHLKERRC